MRVIVGAEEAVTLMAVPAMVVNWLYCTSTLSLPVTNTPSLRPFVKVLGVAELPTITSSESYT